MLNKLGRVIHDAIVLVTFGRLQVHVAAISPFASVLIADGRPFILARRRIVVGLELETDHRRLQAEQLTKNNMVVRL